MFWRLAKRRRHANCLWRLDICQKNQSWQSPGSCRASHRSMVSNNWARGYWRREHCGESSTTCQDAQDVLNSRRKNCIVRTRIESCALYTYVQEKKKLKICVCAEKINDKSCRPWNFLETGSIHLHRLESGLIVTSASQFLLLTVPISNMTRLSTAANLPSTLRISTVKAVQSTGRLKKFLFHLSLFVLEKIGKKKKVFANIISSLQPRWFFEKKGLMNSVGLCCFPTSRSYRRILGQTPLESPESYQFRTSSPRRTPNKSRTWTRPVRWPTRTPSAITFSSSLYLLPSTPPGPNASKTTCGEDLHLGLHRRGGIVCLRRPESLVKSFTFLPQCHWRFQGRSHAW